MERKTVHRLVLSKETVRALADPELVRVAGATLLGCTSEPEEPPVTCQGASCDDTCFDLRE